MNSENQKVFNDAIRFAHEYTDFRMKMQKLNEEDDHKFVNQMKKLASNTTIPVQQVFEIARAAFDTQATEDLPKMI